MRLPPAIIGSTEEVLREVLRFTAPADSTLSRYFRDHPRLGARERGVVAEAVYGLLRNKATYTSFAESGAGSMMRRMALLGLADAVSVDALGGLSEQEQHWLQRVMEIDRSNLSQLQRTNMPEWIFERLVAQLLILNRVEPQATMPAPVPEHLVRWQPRPVLY